jgi:lipid II:glycine glycyltransferase (peptidoglycan interpeptide bridge formation enzyme)
MNDEIQIIDPREAPDWDAFVASHQDATVFHTSAWANVILDSYRYKPLYHVARDESGAIRAAIPLMQVEGWLTSRRLVGLPFSDLCAPLLDASPQSRALLDAVKVLSETSDAGHLELRGTSALSPETAGFDPGEAFYQHIVPVRETEAETEKQLHSSARRAVRKAAKEGLSVRASADEADMRQFYRLMVMTRRKHGLLPQPWRFFAAIQRHMMDTGHGKLLLSEHGGKIIAGDLLLQFRNEMVYKFNASDPAFLHLRPNNILLWEAIRLSATQGCTSLDLGRCDEENEGLRRFKMLWGSEERLLRYFTYKPAGARNGRLATSAPGRALLGFFVKYAPPFALQRMGAAVYHNFG